jgi:putative membrane protein
MKKTIQVSQGSSLKRVIIAISIAVPLVVAILFFLPEKLNLGDFVYILPHLNAVINSTTAIVMILALVMVKTGNIEFHRYLMTTALVLGGLFLVSYVLYHASVPSVIYGDANGDGILSEAEKLEAGNRTTYLLILLSHIGLSVVTLPLVLIAFYRASTGNYKGHKKIVKWAFPIWFYVSVTGVIVYALINPYY